MLAGQPVALGEPDRPVRHLEGDGDHQHSTMTRRLMGQIQAERHGDPGLAGPASPCGVEGRSVVGRGRRRPPLSSPPWWPPLSSPGSGVAVAAVGVAGLVGAAGRRRARWRSPWSSPGSGSPWAPVAAGLIAVAAVVGDVLGGQPPGRRPAPARPGRRVVAGLVGRALVPGRRRRRGGGGDRPGVGAVVAVVTAGSSAPWRDGRPGRRRHGAGWSGRGGGVVGGGCVAAQAPTPGWRRGLRRRRGR